MPPIGRSPFTLISPYWRFGNISDIIGVKTALDWQLLRELGSKFSALLGSNLKLPNATFERLFSNARLFAQLFSARFKELTKLSLQLPNWLLPIFNRDGDKLFENMLF